MEYICYCDKVTEEDIVRAIGQGARTIRDIQRMTGAMTHCDCANKNPKGTGCTPDILRVLRKHLPKPAK